MMRQPAHVSGRFLPGRMVCAVTAFTGPLNDRVRFRGLSHANEMQVSGQLVDQTFAASWTFERTLQSPRLIRITAMSRIAR